MTTPTKGLRFIHRSWLDDDYRPLMFEVTKVAVGTVYYKAVYDGKLQRRGCMFCSIETFDRYVKEIVPAKEIDLSRF